LGLKLVSHTSSPNIVCMCIGLIFLHKREILHFKTKCAIFDDLRETNDDAIKIARDCVYLQQSLGK
jgi:hypothetical protein